MSVELEHGIRTYAAYLDEVLPTITADEVMADVIRMAPAWPLRWWRRPVLVAVAAAIFVLVVIGGTAWLIGGGDTVDQTPVTTPPATTTTTTVSEALGTALHWAAVTDPEAFGGEEARAILAVTRGDDRYVAVGVEGADPRSAGALRHPVEEWDQDAAFWTSFDGTAWTRVPHDESIFGGDGLWVAEDVIVGGPGFVAVGWGGPQSPQGDIDAAVWTSTNGEQWNRITDEDLTDAAPVAAMYGIANTGNGLVAVGMVVRGDIDTGRVEPAVWTSVDGLEWERVPQGEWALGGRMYAVASSEQGLTAVGVVEEENGSAGAVWTSPDGMTWTRLDGDPAVFRDLPDGSPPPDWIYNTELHTITATKDGLVAAGHDFAFNPTGVWADETMSPRAVVLISTDGTVWERVELQRPTGSAIWSVVESHKRIIALGGSAIWVSGDGGRTWVIEQRTVGEWLDAAPGDVGPVAVGQVGGDGAVWIGTWNEN